jgi:hypothetical protein
VASVGQSKAAGVPQHVLRLCLETVVQVWTDLFTMGRRTSQRPWGTGCEMPDETPLRPFQHVRQFGDAGRESLRRCLSLRRVLLQKAVSAAGCGPGCTR